VIEEAGEVLDADAFENLGVVESFEVDGFSLFMLIGRLYGTGL